MDFIHLEKVSSCTSSFFFQCLAYSSHESMIILKFWFYVKDLLPLYIGPFFNNSLNLSFLTILRSPVSNVSTRRVVKIR